MVLDNHISKTIQDSSKLASKFENFQSREPLNALPKAEIEKLKKEIADELARNKSLASGNAFNTMDLEKRIVALEKSQVKGWQKLDAVGKSVSIIKNRTDPQAEDLPENRQYELDRIRYVIFCIRNKSGPKKSFLLENEFDSWKKDIWRMSQEIFSTIQWRAGLTYCRKIWRKSERRPS